MRDEHLIYIFYTRTGNAHACGFKAQEEASDAEAHAIVSSGSCHVMNPCGRSVEGVPHTADPELLMSAVAMLAQASVFKDGGVTKTKLDQP